MTIRKEKRAQGFRPPIIVPGDVLDRQVRRFRGIGVYDNALHFDVGADRAWGASYSRDSLPAWAAGAVSAKRSLFRVASNTARSAGAKANGGHGRAGRGAGGPNIAARCKRT